MTTYRLDFTVIDCTFERTKHSVNFARLSNAVDMATRVSLCADVVGEVVVSNAMTGEVMYARENGKETVPLFD